jgi:iron complex transport system substrate-binding protein
MANIGRTLILLGLMTATAAGPAAAHDAKPLSILDDRNVTVEVPANPQRIAAISYLAVDVAFALGIKPIATTYMMPGRNPDFLGGLAKDIPQIGQRARPNLELLSAAKPDLIVAMKRYTAGYAEQLQKIAPYLAYNMELMTESYREVAELARIMGQPERGKQLNAQFKQHLADYVGRRLAHSVSHGKHCGHHHDAVGRAEHHGAHENRRPVCLLDQPGNPAGKGSRHHARNGVA